MPTIPAGWDLQSLLNAGGIPYAANAIMRGLSEANVMAELRGQFPPAHTQTLQALYDRAAQAHAAGQRITTALPDEALRAYEVPRGPNTGLGYRYSTVASIVEAQTGIEIDRMFTVDSPTSLTAEALREHVYEMARQRYAPGSDWYTSTKLAPGWLINQYETYSVQRA